MKKIENPIKELKTRIQKHIDNSGSIYQPKRQLPYYDYLCNVKDRLSKEHNTTYDVADIYKMCGYDFDPEYAIHLSIVSDLQDLSDEHNYVDKKQNFKDTKPATYSKLCFRATKHGSCLYDYMVIMTGYRLKDANINLDYELALKERLKKAYPSKDITGIKRDNPELYEMLRHLKRYRYPTLPMVDIIDILGFDNERMKNENYSKSINETEVIDHLAKLYPNKKIDESLFQNKELYYKVIKISILKKISVVSYLNSLGFEYTQGNLVERLAQMKVNEKARYNFLMQKKKEFYIEKNASSLTDKERYYLNLELIEKIAQIDNIEEFIKNDDYDV